MIFDVKGFLKTWVTFSVLCLFPVYIFPSSVVFQSTPSSLNYKRKLLTYFISLALPWITMYLHRTLCISNYIHWVLVFLFGDQHLSESSWYFVKVAPAAELHETRAPCCVADWNKSFSIFYKGDSIFVTYNLIYRFEFFELKLKFNRTLFSLF